MHSTRRGVTESAWSWDNRCRGPARIGTTINGADKFIKRERIALLPAGDNLKTGLHIGSEETRAFRLGGAQRALQHLVGTSE